MGDMDKLQLEFAKQDAFYLIVYGTLNMHAEFGNIIHNIMNI